MTKKKQVKTTMNKKAKIDLTVLFYLNIFNFENQMKLN